MRKYVVSAVVGLFVVIGGAVPSATATDLTPGGGTDPSQVQTDDGRIWWPDATGAVCPPDECPTGRVRQTTPGTPAPSAPVPSTAAPKRP